MNVCINVLKVAATKEKNIAHRHSETIRSSSAFVFLIFFFLCFFGFLVFKSWCNGDNAAGFNSSKKKIKIKRERKKEEDTKETTRQQRKHQAKINGLQT